MSNEQVQLTIGVCVRCGEKAPRTLESYTTHNLRVPNHCGCGGDIVWNCQNEECRVALRGPTQVFQTRPLRSRILPGLGPQNSCDACGIRHPWADAIERRERAMRRRKFWMRFERIAFRWSNLIAGVIGALLMAIGAAVGVVLKIWLG